MKVAVHKIREPPPAPPGPALAGMARLYYARGGMKKYLPNIRVISVDHDRSKRAAAHLRRALDEHDYYNITVLESFCNLEAGRWGVPSGLVAVDVDGQIVWRGAELTEDLAKRFCACLPAYIRRKKDELGPA